MISLYVTCEFIKFFDAHISGTDLVSYYTFGDRKKKNKNSLSDSKLKWYNTYS